MKIARAASRPNNFTEIPLDSNISTDSQSCSKCLWLRGESSWKGWKWKREEKWKEMEMNLMNSWFSHCQIIYVQGKIGLCWLCWLCYKLKAILSILHEVESVRNFVAHVASAIGVYTLRWTCHLPKQVEKVANWCQLKHVEQTATKPISRTYIKQLL